MIPLYEPCLQGREVEYVTDCIESGWVSSVGSFVNRFESEFATCVGCDHAVATSSGTSALHTALLVAGVGPEDEVLVSTFTFIAPVNAIRYCGAMPILVDAERDFWQIDADKVESFLKSECECRAGETWNRRSGRRIRAIVAVDLYGHPVDVARIAECARNHGMIFIEDASESLGARYRGRPLGSEADIACFSFNGNKIITTGGGGMLTTSNSDWAERARYLTTQAKDSGVEYVHGEVGYNYRLTNVQAALGVAQLEQLPVFLRRKRAIVAGYAHRLADIPGVRLAGEADWAESTGWLVNVEIDPALAGGPPALLQALQEKGIQSRPVWRPVHLQKPYAECQVIGGDVAEEIHGSGLSLPSSVALSEAQLDEVTEAIATWVQAAAR